MVHRPGHAGRHALQDDPSRPGRGADADSGKPATKRSPPKSEVPADIPRDYFERSQFRSSLSLMTSLSLTRAAGARKDGLANGFSASVGRAGWIMSSNSRDWPGWMRRSLRGAEELPLHAQDRMLLFHARVETRSRECGQRSRTPRQRPARRVPARPRAWRLKPPPVNGLGGRAPWPSSPAPRPPRTSAGRPRIGTDSARFSGASAGMPGRTRSDVESRADIAGRTIHWLHPGSGVFPHGTP